MTAKNKIALVTGASRGIGQSIAIELGRAGYYVAATATSDEGVNKIREDFAENKINGRAYVLNITESDAVKTVYESIVTDLGVPLILVNNAGITRDTLFLRMKEEDFEAVINTNLTGAFRLTKQCLRGMLKAEWGRIISIGSVMGALGNPGQANYAASKAGLAGMMRSLAAEVGSRNITANVVAPGFIETDMTANVKDDNLERLLKTIPLARVGKPIDIARTVLFLASENASYITGQTLYVDGGMHMA